MRPIEPFVIHEKDCKREYRNDPETGCVSWATLLSADQTPTKDLTVGIFEIEPCEDGEFRQHRHEHVETYFVLSGSGVVTIASVEYSVRAGTTIFIPGGVEHGTRNVGRGSLRILYVFPADSFDQIKYEFKKIE